MSDRKFSPKKITEDLLLTQVFVNDENGQPLETSKIQTEVFQHLEVLESSLAVDSPQMFTDYVEWFEALRENRREDASSMGLLLDGLQSVLVEDKAREAYQELIPFLEYASRVDDRSGGTDSGVSFIQENLPFGREASRYFESVLIGNRLEVYRLVNEFLSSGMTIQQVYLHVFQPVERELGRLWQLNQLTIEQEHRGTSLTRLMMKQFLPDTPDIHRKQCVVAASVSTELHDLGLRMVTDFFELDGWQTVYLGSNVSLDSILQAIRESKASLLALSATISSHVKEVQRVIAAVRESDVGNIHIIVGGYPFNLDPEAWRRVGADGYAQDAKGAVTMGNQLTRRQ